MTSERLMKKLDDKALVSLEQKQKQLIEQLQSDMSS